jgi:hypothetical protein
MADTRKTIPELRWVLAIFVALAAAATGVLFFLPSETNGYFAWTIASPLTATMLGAAYASALVLFALSLAETTWANARLTIPAPLTLSTALLVATLMHLDKFHLAAAPVPATVAWIWLVVYVVVPPALVLVYLKQRRTPGVDPPRGRPIPQPLRLLLLVLGLTMLATGAALFIAPAVVEPTWPWALTPLTARAVAAWSLGLAVAAFHGLIENDVRRLRAGLAAFSVFGLFALVAVWRYAAEIRWELASAWVLILALGLISISGLAGLLAARPAVTNPSPSSEA